MSELDKAIKLLKKNYKLAKEREYIKNPLAYALYRTWWQYDKQEIDWSDEE